MYYFMREHVFEMGCVRYVCAKPSDAHADEAYICAPKIDTHVEYLKHLITPASPAAPQGHY